MPQLWTDTSQSSLLYDPLGALSKAAVSLSDGVTVYLIYDGTDVRLKYCAPGGTPQLIDSLTISGAGGAVIANGPSGFLNIANQAQSNIGICVDASDNIYLSFAPATGTADWQFKAYAKGAGHSWTPKTTQASTVATGGGVVYDLKWCNTTGGTGGHGHLLLAYQESVPNMGMAVIDAGAVLAASGATATATSSPTVATIYDADICQTGALGNPSGVVIYPQNVGGGAFDVGSLTWTIGSAGTFTSGPTAVANATGGFGTPTRADVFYTNGVVVVGVAGTVLYACSFTTAGAVISNLVSAGSPAGWPTVTSAALTYDFFQDPATVGRVWCLAGDTPTGGSQQMVRLGLTVTATTLTWATSITSDDVLTNVGGTIANPHLRAVPFTQGGGHVDWQNFVEVSGSSFVLDGDATIFDTPPTITGISATQSLFPLITWTYNNASGYACQKFRVKIFTTAQAGIGGFNPDTSPNTWDSGDVVSTATSITSATAIFAGTYDVYVKAADVVGGVYGPWNFLPFTQTTTELPATPVIVTATNDDTNAAIRLFIQGRDNMLTANQSNLELGTTAGWTAEANTTATASTTVALDGTHSLRLAATGAGAVGASTPTGLSGVPVSPSLQITALASFRASATGDTATVEILWYKASGAASSVRTSDTSTGVTVTTGTWTQASVTVTSPSDAAFCAVVVNGTGLGAGGFLYADQISVAPGASTTWTVGGYVVGPQSLVLQRSIDNGVTWVTLSRLWRQTEAGFSYYLNAGFVVIIAHAMVGNEAVYGSAAPTPAGVPDIGQTWQVIDYEAPRASTTVVYRAQIMSFDSGGNPIVSAQSANVTAPQINIVRTAFKAVNNPTLNKTLYTKKPGIKATPTEPQIIQPVLGAPDVSVIYDTIYGDSLDFTVICLTQAEHDAYRTLFSAQDTVLIQDFLGRQWYTHLGPTPAVAPGQGALQGSAYYEIAHGAQQVAVPA